MMEKKKNSIDMTHGALWNKILIFALPLAASSILQQLFNSVDTAVVGNFASSQALAAVGSNSSLIALMINLFIGISLGSNVIISRYIGQGVHKNIKAAIHTAIVVALAGGIFLLVLGQFIARPVLVLMGTPDDVIDLAVLYLRIYFLGMPFILLYDFCSSILRSTGDSRRPLYALIAAGVINTGLNLILVIAFHLGVSGVAIATVVSNIVSSGILIYILLHEDDPIRLEPKALAISWHELKKILVIGVPAGLQGMVFSIANVCIQSTINSFGSDAVAGSAASLNFEYFSYFVVNAFAQTTVTFTSQNYGAGKYDRCKIGETVYRYLRRFTVKTDEKANQQIRINSECHRCNHTADHSRQQRNTFRRHHSFLVAQSEIIADNRLGRLCNSITYHENKRNIIARYTECPYAIVPQIGHKYLVPDEHKNSKRCLSQ